MKIPYYLLKWISISQPADTKRLQMNYSVYLKNLYWWWYDFKVWVLVWILLWSVHT